MTTPAGWYDDGSGRQRYWDGTQWTEHFAPAAPPPPTAPAAPPPPTAPAALPAVPGATAPQPSAESYATLPPPGQAELAPQKKSRVGLYIGLGVGALLLVVIGVVLAAVLLFQNALGGPRDAFNELADAWQAKDCQAVYAVSIESSTMTVEDFCSSTDYSWVDDYQDWDISVTGVERVNDVATVTTRERFTDPDTGERKTEVWDYTFENVGGKWLVSQLDEVLD